METEDRFKFDAYLLKRLALFCIFLCILLLIQVMGQFLPVVMVYGYTTDMTDMAISDYILSYHHADMIIRELTFGETAYVAHMDRSYSGEDKYYVTALDISDLMNPFTIWSIEISGCIEDMVQKSGILYISTTSNEVWVVDLYAPDGPRLVAAEIHEELQTKTRYRDVLTSLQYPTSNLFDYTNPFSGFNLNLNIGSLFPQTYSLTGLNTFSQYIQPWNLTSPLNNNFSFYSPSFYTPNNYTFGTSLYSPGTYSYNLGLSPYSLGTSPFNLGLSAYNLGTSLYNQWGLSMSQYNLYPWSFSGGGLGYTLPFSYPGQTTSTKPSSGSTTVRYRSPVNINLSLTNPSGTAATGKITLSLFDLNGQKVSNQQETLTLEPGQHDYGLALIKVPENTSVEDFAKYNLRYVFSGEGLTIDKQKSLFHLADKLEVRMIGTDDMYAGQPNTLGVHAIVHGRPVSVQDASVSVDLVMGNKTYTLFNDKTDEDGFAKASLDIPENLIGTGKIRAKVVSDLGTEVLTEDIEIVRAFKILLTTDKPIYQPGQTIHIRTLTLKKPDLKPAEDKEITIEIEDSKGNKVFRSASDADEFGVTSEDFTLGRDINMGLYTIRAICVENDIPTESEKQVNVERYVLPKFKVDLETDSEFYSPGDSVHGHIHAEYFFGKALENATVTIDASKFDVEFVLFQTITGQTDADGFFSFDIVLPSYFVGLPLEQGDAFVKLDIKVEDTAEHVESIVRELTVTKDPINVRVIPESGKIVLDVENKIYLMTTDPKGRGISTTNLVDFDGQVFNVDTDDEGLGTFTVIPDETSSLIFQVTSHANGQSVQVKIDLSDTSGQDRILVRTNKTIYRVGQTMTIDVYTPESVMARRAFVDIIRERQTLYTKGLDIVDGQGQSLIDISNDMAGTLQVEAYYISQSKETASDVFRDKKIVYVNPADDIQVTTALDKDEYLPGEKATITFQVNPPQTAALGVTIVDEAVFALQENRPALLKVYFSMEEDILQPRFMPLMFPFEEALTSEDPTDDIQEMAELVLATVKDPGGPGLDESSYPNLVLKMKEKLVSRIDKDADKVAKDLGNLGIYSEWSYNNALDQGKISTYKDPWGNPYKLSVGSNQVTLTSNGPDEISGNLDDILLVKEYQPVYKPYVGGGWGGYYGGYGGYGYAAYGGGGGTGGTYTPETGAGYLAFYTPGEETPPEEQEPTQEPRKIRKDFPETLLWEPSLITDPNGTAFMDANMADSITTWRMSTMASTLEGKLGGSTEGIVVFQDFFIDLDLPVALTQNDEISMPVAIYNYLEESQTVYISLHIDESNPWFELLDSSQKQVDLDAGEITVVYFRIRALEVGWHELTVFGNGTTMSDAIARRIEVLPDGMEFNVDVSDRLSEGEAGHAIHIPEAAIDGASKIMVEVYPGIFSQMVEGLDRLFKVPSGCFTQSTTITWPNVLVLDYMLTTNQIAPEIEMKAREYINLGYQRLLTFECPNGGFSWYGNEPGKPILTAYGLMEFTDMARVQYVDPDMISRSQQWLIGKQQPDGSWPPDQVRELFNVISNKLQGTAFATWALMHSGYSKNDSRIIKGLDYVRSLWDDMDDTYTQALCAHALLEWDSKEPTGLSILDLLESKKIVEGDTVHWESSGASFTYSRGSNLDLETTAMIAWALIKAGWRYPNSINGAINYIIQNKDSIGLWRQTQATVLSLRVLMLAMGGQTDEMDAELIVTINGHVLDKDALPILKINPVDSSVLRQIDLQPYTAEGDNDVSIRLLGEGNLLYQIVGTYFLPWDDVTLPSSPQLEIDINYDRTQLTVDDFILCTVTVTNTVPDSVTQLGMLDLGIPPGFQISFDDFDMAIEQDKIFKYESTNRQLTLYLHPLAFGEPLSITYHLQAKYPLKVATPKSRAYDFYNPDVQDETKPVTITVVE